MAIIDLVKWDGGPDIYAWKFPEDNLSTWAQLVVHESQEAILFAKGELLAKFGPGRHTLNTENIPLLRSLFGIPFGGQNPFTAQVWFVNKAIALDVKWGTPVPIQLREPEFNIMVPVRAAGQFGVAITNPETFLLKLVGTLPSFERPTMRKYLKGVLLKHAGDIIAKKVALEKISVLELSAHLVAISDHMEQALNEAFQQFGVSITTFNVTTINVPDEDPSVANLKEVLNKRLEMQALGYSYQDERSFNVLDKAVEKGGVAGVAEGRGMGTNMMDATLGMAMGVNVANMVGGMMSGMVGPTGQAAGAGGPGQGALGQAAVGQGAVAQGAPAAAEENEGVLCDKCGTEISPTAKFCGGCGKRTEMSTAVDSAQQFVPCDKCEGNIPVTAKFCPNCGDPYNPCLGCGADNPEGALACRSCQAALPRPCGKCETKVAAAAKFCPNCGHSMSPACVKCNAELSVGAKFCGECGAPQQAGGG